MSANIGEPTRDELINALGWCARQLDILAEGERKVINPSGTDDPKLYEYTSAKNAKQVLSRIRETKTT